jgi:hypothetical protein
LRACGAPPAQPHAARHAGKLLAYWMGLHPGVSWQNCSLTFAGMTTGRCKEEDKGEKEGEREEGGRKRGREGEIETGRDCPKREQGNTKRQRASSSKRERVSAPQHISAWQSVSMASQRPSPRTHTRVRRLPTAGTNRDALCPTVLEC